MRSGGESATRSGSWSRGGTAPGARESLATARVAADGFARGRSETVSDAVDDCGGRDFSDLGPLRVLGGIGQGPHADERDVEIAVPRRQPV
jgi:hypothetical protein